MFTIGDAIASLRRQGVAPEGGRGRNRFYTPTQQFDEWLSLEQDSLEQNDNWLTQLTPCQSTIETCGGDPQNPDENLWNDPGLANSEHPGAEFEIRSKPTPGGHANQCTYDINGNILTAVPAAGSADYVSLDQSIFGHLSHDLRPWWLAEQLDRRDDYFEVRPILVTP